MALNRRRAGFAAAITVLACSRGEAPGPRLQPERSARMERAPSSLPEAQRSRTNQTGGQPSFAFGAAAGASSSGIGGAPERAAAAGTMAASDARLPPLAGSEPFVSLEVSEANPSVVSLPLGATSPRPVAVALHGNFDRPEWQCEVWRGVLGARGFILCPRGIPRRDAPASADRWEYGSVKAVEKEIEAGLVALRARFGPYVDSGPLLFIGFSLGAIYGAAVVQKHPELFPRVVLIEGGQERWSYPNARKFVKGGGLRLFIGCGQIACLASVKQLAPMLERLGLPTRSGGQPKAGHTYDGEVAASVARELPWLLQGDPRWELPSGG